MKSCLLTLVLVTNGLLSNAGEAATLAGEYLVKFKDKRNISSHTKVSLEQKLQSNIKSILPEANVIIVKRPIVETQDYAMEVLSKNADVEYVEPVFLYRLTTLPNDLYLNEQWGLKNFGQKDAQKRKGFIDVDIAAEKAWQITTGSSDVVVAVIDSGVNYEHPDLKENIWSNLEEVNGKAGVDDDGNGFVDDIHGYSFELGKESGNPMDVIGHGTHCAGIIGARGNNGQGIVGVNWNVKLMPIKFISPTGEGSSEAAIKSIDYAIKNGAHIISNSWGGGEYSRALEEAIERANKKGILFVAAAGNDQKDNDANPFYPASYKVENVIAVTAIDNQGRLAPFSNFGKKSVHVAAPGMNIASTVLKDFIVSSGTSMAAPFVSGIAALLLANEPNLNSDELKDRIISTTMPLSGLQGKILNRGLANAYFALTNTKTTSTAEDPSNWKNVYNLPVILSSNHPYQNKTNIKFEVKIPGAKEFSLYLPKIAMDPGFDFVVIKDASGKIVDKISERKNTDIYSAVVKGDTANVEFISDSSINGWGFDITKAVWQ